MEQVLNESTPAGRSARAMSAAATVGGHAPISEAEFRSIRDWIFRVAGIHMSDSKKALVMGRLAARLRQHKLERYGEYFALLQRPENADEVQIAIDLLTTNETYFFREPKHFEYLETQILAHHLPGRPFRVWSAACSTGEEVWSIAMTLANRLGEGTWELLGSDLSARVLQRARAAHYPMARTKNLAREYLTRYCLKGVDAQTGTFLIEPRLRSHVQFAQINLNEALPNVGEFDVIFIRNAMIYFNMETKREVTARLVRHLRPGGYFIVGHSESLNGLSDELRMIQPSVYRKP